MLYSFGCYISSPFPDVLVMLAAVFRSLYMESERVDALHKRPKTSTVGVRQSFRVPEGFRPQATLAKLGGKHPGGHVADAGTFLVVFFLPRLRRTCSWILSGPGWARTPKENKMQWKKINQHRSQIYDPHRRRVYQISWNIFGRRLIIIGSLGASGKMWDVSTGDVQLSASP